MKGLKKIVVLTGIVILAMTVLYACSFFPWDFSKKGWYIMLNIDIPTGAKTLGVSEHDVTGLHIEMFDPDGEPLESVDWDAAAPWDQPYVVHVNREGDYGIEVTHISDDNGEIVEASEYEEFHIKSMIITVINITPGVIGTIVVQEPGGGTQPADGTLTVHLTEMGVPDDTTAAIGLYPHGVDPMVDPLGSMLAMGGDPIVGGESHSILKVSQGDTDWIGTGGELYDLYIWLGMRWLEEGQPGLEDVNLDYAAGTLTITRYDSMGIAGTLDLGTTLSGSFDVSFWEQWSPE